MATSRPTALSSIRAAKTVLFVLGALLCLGSFTACKGETTNPQDPADVGTDTGGQSDISDDTQEGDGEADADDDAGTGGTSAATPLVPTLAGGTAGSDGFSTRFSLTVPVATEAAESDSYRLNTGQFTFPTPPSEDPVDDTTSDE